MVVQFRSEASNTLPTDSAHTVATTYITAEAHIDEDDANTNDDSWIQCEGDGTTTFSGKRNNGLCRIQLPERPDAAAGDISKVVLNLYGQSTNAGTNHIDTIQIFNLKNPGWVKDEVTWNVYKSGTAWATTGGDYDTSTDWAGLGGGVIAEEGRGGSGAWHSFNLGPICVADKRGKGKYNWGDELNLLFFMRGVYDGSGTQTNNGMQNFFPADYSTTGSVQRGYVEIFFDNPAPTAPFISVIPDINGIDPKVQVDKHSDSEAIARYSLGWKATASVIEHGGSGVDMTDSDAAGLGTQPTIWPASKMSTTTLLDTEDVAYSVFIVAEKNYNLDAAGSKSNQVTIARPKVDTASSAGTKSGVLTGSNAAATKTVSIGEEVQIRIQSTSSVHSGNIKRFWINWEANISDTAEDYGQFDVDENIDGSTTVTNKTFTHVYDRDEASDFTIKVQVEDEVGFRSNTTLIATITVSTPTPVAKLTTSRSQIIEAEKADINNTVVVSGQHSYAQGSNRYIKGYKYKHNGGGSNAPLTAFPTANDNSVIYNAGSSQRIALGSSLDNCNGNDFRVYGVYSVNDAGASVSDIDNNFSHYVWGYELIQPHSSEAQLTDGSVYFKHIEYVVCISATIDDSDTGAYYTLALRSDHDTHINNQLAVEKDNYKWGGYYGSAAASCTVTGTNTYDQASGTNYFKSVLGLRPGDKVIVSGGSTSENNGIKTVTGATEDKLTVAETLTNNGSAETFTFERVTDNIVSVPVAAYAAQTNVITHDVVDDNAQSSASTSTQTISVLSDNTLSYNLTTDVDAGHIAILNTTLSRSGGLSPIMTTGDRRYPLGLSRTKLGLPTLTMSVRVMSNEGLRNMWSLVEGDRFAWVTLKKHLIDAPDPLVPYKTLRLKPTTASLSKTPTDNKDYTASLTFVVMGEDI